MLPRCRSPQSVESASLQGSFFSGTFWRRAEEGLFASGWMPPTRAVLGRSGQLTACAARGRWGNGRSACPRRESSRASGLPIQGLRPPPRCRSNYQRRRSGPASPRWVSTKRTRGRTVRRVGGRRCWVRCPSTRGPSPPKTLHLRSEKTRDSLRAPRRAGLWPGGREWRAGADRGFRGRGAFSPKTASLPRSWGWRAECEGVGGASLQRATWPRARMTSRKPRGSTGTPREDNDGAANARRAVAGREGTGRALIPCWRSRRWKSGGECPRCRSARRTCACSEPCPRPPCPRNRPRLPCKRAAEKSNRKRIIVLVQLKASVLVQRFFRRSRYNRSRASCRTNAIFLTLKPFDWGIYISLWVFKNERQWNLILLILNFYLWNYWVTRKLSLKSLM